MVFIFIGMIAFAPFVFAQQDFNSTTTTATTISPTNSVQSAPMTVSITESTQPWQVSVQGGGFWSERNRVHDGEAIFGRLTYDVTPYVALGGESGGIRFNDKSDGLKYGHLDGVPAMADVVLKLPLGFTGNRLVPYVFGAAGVIFWSYSESGYSDTTGVNARSRIHFAARPGAGLEYYLTPHIALFVELSYLYSERFKLKNASTTPPNGNINPDSGYAGGGIKIAF